MFVYFNFLKSNESLFYTLIKVIIHHRIKIMQIIKIKVIILNLCIRNNLRDYWMKLHKEKHTYNYMYDKMKNTLEIQEKFSNINTVNGWEITKIVLAKQKSSSNETKINNNRVKKINL